MQRTVKRQFSMFFRNRRRRSEPASNRVQKSKLVIIVAAKPAENPNREIVTDTVAFERNHSRLLGEFQKAVPNNVNMSLLIKETHEERRNRLSTSSEKMTILLQEYPYFANKKYVSKLRVCVCSYRLDNNIYRLTKVVYSVQSSITLIAWLLFLLI